MNVKGVAREMIIRRMQVRSVAIGVAGSVLFLLGLSLQLYVMAWLGLTVFVLALMSVLILGAWAWRHVDNGRSE